MLVRDIRQRLQWVMLYEQTQDAGLVCRRCGISRPTLRKWVKRYNEHGVSGLESLSRQPHGSPNRKVYQREESLILEMRKNRRLGARRIQNELLRLHEISLSLRTIHKILSRHNVKPLKRPRRTASPIRCEKDIPGERIQMDSTKVGARKYQYTAVDDCTRYRVLAIFPRRTARNTLLFLDQVLEEMPFPVQRIQTDRGREFFATKVQERLMEYGIKFRPIKPASPHLNGKVERSQRTDKEEFYATIDVQNTGFKILRAALAEWQHHYNWERPHGSPNGQTPMDVLLNKLPETPFTEDVLNNYDVTKERIQDPNYRMDLLLRRLKGSV